MNVKDLIFIKDRIKENIGRSVRMDIRPGGDVLTEMLVLCEPESGGDTAYSLSTIDRGGFTDLGMHVKKDRGRIADHVAATLKHIMGE